MYLSQITFLIHQERYKELLREAERYRLVRKVRAGREKRHLSYRQALAWLGRRLIAWGWRLQERYGAATATPALRAACKSHPLS